MPEGQWFRDDPSPGSSTSPLPVTPPHGAPPPGPAAPPTGPAEPEGFIGLWWASADRPTAAAQASRPRTVNRTWLIAAGFIVLAGLLGVVIGLLSHGDGKAATGGIETADAPDTVQPREQAIALDRLLSGSHEDRQAVVSAVVSLQQCRNLAASTATLRDAASSRQALVTRLDKVETSKIPGGTRLKSTLREAWQSSADADRAFARWGRQISAGGCPGGQPKKTAAYRAGVHSSAGASRAKKSFVDQWNEVASRFDLKPRKFSQI